MKHKSVPGLVLLVIMLVVGARADAQPITPGKMISMGGSVNNYVIVTNFSACPSNAFTVELWMWSTTTTNKAGLVSYAATNGSANTILVYNPVNLQLLVNGATGQQSGINVADGTWHHIAMCWTNSGTATIYVDGTLRLTQNNFAVGAVLSPGGNLVLGQQQNTVGGGFDARTSFFGAMDEVRMWNRVLTQSEISSNMHHALSNNVPGLVAYYRLDDDALTATNAVDATTNVGTIAGSPPFTSGVPFIPGIASETFATGATNAILYASVFPNNLSTKGRFEWGATTNPYPNTNIIEDFGSGAGSVTVTNVPSNLTNGATMHFRFVATNPTGTNVGADVTFTVGSLLVTNTADSGEASIRSAIASALDDAVIRFSRSMTISMQPGELLITNDLTIMGTNIGLIQVAGPVRSRILNIATGAVVSISGVTLQGGVQQLILGGGNYDGGAILNNGSLTLSNCNVASSSCTFAQFIAGVLYPPGRGGGLANYGQATIANCLFSGNTAGGGAYVITNSAPGADGGGIYNAGTLDITRSLFLLNGAGAGGRGPTNASPGGNGGAIANDGTLSVSQCTFGQNHAGAAAASFDNLVSSRAGQGAIYNAPGKSATIVACTVANNANPSGGIFSATNASTMCQSCIIAVNPGYDVSGLFISQGHNFIGAINGGIGFIDSLNGDHYGFTNAPLNLLLTGLSGTLTATNGYNLFAGSPAIDAGDDALATLGTDQHGFPRLYGAHVDAGAFEQSFATWPNLSVTTLNASIAADPAAGGSTVTFNASVIPGAYPPNVYFEYGLSTNYGATTASQSIAASRGASITTLTAFRVGEGYTLHYRAVASNGTQTVYGGDQTLFVPFQNIPGDVNRDGILSQAELQAVLTNYAGSPLWLQMTNATGLGTTNFSFSLSNDVATTYNVEVSTNLVDWQLLGPALPRYDVLDTNAVDNAQRYYRLRLP